MTTGHYPNLDAPAWTVLLRAEPGRAITLHYCAEIVGPYLAAEALVQLEQRHLVEKGAFMPVALAVRRWNRQ